MLPTIRTLRTAALLICLAGTSPLIAKEARGGAQYLVGTDSSAMESFPGGQGNGWKDAWKVMYPAQYEGDFILKVVETNPLPESSRRLEIRPKETTDKEQIKLGRTLERSAFDASRPYTVSGQVRFDSIRPNSEGFPFTFSSQQAGESEGVAGSIWYLTVLRGYWHVAGQNNDANGIIWKKLSIPVEDGVAYSFRIEIDPANLTYQAVVSNGRDEAQSPMMHSAKPHTDTSSDVDILLRVGTNKTDRFTCSLASLKIAADPEK